MLATEKTRPGAATAALVRRSVLTHAEQLATRRDESDEPIATLIESDDDGKNQRDLLTSVPGVGAATANALVAGRGELGKLDRQAIAALAGVAPMNADSGPPRGKRVIRGGRENVRCVLYMAAFPAMRLDPTPEAFADRPGAAGQPFKLGAVAAMRKLLTLLNVMARENQRWNPKLKTA